ncbi:MAG: ThuA domain-containing protein [Defluviitaleaceae bacterium]|nr:ThuA domain-containing protein [Defluviitaleaceae bacterium]
MLKKINVTVWNEAAGNQAAYPEGIHTVIANFLKGNEAIGILRTATLNQPYHGLTPEVLEDTDVLIWWGHSFHDKVEDEIVEQVRRRILKGMGLIVLHSGHASKIFKTMLGTDTLQLRWREADELERVWVIEHNHPITVGLGEYIEIPKSETYGEFFNIPVPDELIFISWFEGGEVLRSGCTFKRGNGKIFYFAPGHETHRIYDMPPIQQVIKNAVKWAAPTEYSHVSSGHHPESPESIYKKNCV